MRQDLLEQYWQAQDPHDPKRLRELRHRDWVAEWPQTGERIRGHENDQLIHDNYPGYPAHRLRRGVQDGERWAVSPMFVPVRVAVGGTFGVGEFAVEYPDGSRWMGVAIAEMRDGLIGRETVYWVEPFEPPAWRRQWVELVPESGAAAFESVDASPEDERGCRSTIERYGELLATGEIGAAARHLYRDDAVQEFPQSGERVVGLENILNVVENHPQRPRGRLVKLHGVGGIFAAEFDLRYDDERWFDVAILQFRDDRVALRTDYFGPPLEAPAWRAQWVERM